MLVKIYNNRVKIQNYLLQVLLLTQKFLLVKNQEHLFDFATSDLYIING